MLSLGYDYDGKTEAQLKRLLSWPAFDFVKEDGQVMELPHAASYDCLYFRLAQS